MKMRRMRGGASLGVTRPICSASAVTGFGKALRSGGLVALWALAGSLGCHQNTDRSGGKCGNSDAGGETEVSDSSAGVASNDPGCPATWSEVSPGGLPATCSSNGLICTYPEGQAECAPDGSVLK